MLNRCIVTTSWDDGNKKDLELASLLNKYSLKGTFYIPKAYYKKSLRKWEMRDIAFQHEIGAHTLTHADLTLIPSNKAKNEVKDSRDYLENLLGRKISMFAYPYGRYNTLIKKIVKHAGFKGARTSENLSIGYPSDNFEIGITTEISPKILKKNIYLCFELARLTFDYIYKNGGVWHLSGHSWEIEKYNFWRTLEKLFSYISEKNIVSCFNSDLLTNLH